MLKYIYIYISLVFENRRLLIGFPDNTKNLKNNLFWIPELWNVFFFCFISDLKTFLSVQKDFTFMSPILSSFSAT